VEFVTNPIDGTNIAYRSTGAGEPIVMVHGTALSQAIWRGLGYVRDLGQDHRVITLDLRGHGRSDKPHDPAAYRMDLFVSDILAVMDTLNVSRAHYVGYSLGGRVGFSLSSAHPDRLNRFVSAGGAPRTGPNAFDNVFFPGCIDVLEWDGMPGFLRGWEARNGSPVDTSTRAAFLADDAIALAAYMRESQDDPGVSDSDLRRMTTRTLLLAGSEDRERVAAAQHALRLMPAAVMDVLEGATHADTLRHPEAKSAIREFLDDGAVADLT
jgi:pimeloyl-ACP methyl ester carboxylesterase